MLSALQTKNYADHTSFFFYKIQKMQKFNLKYLTIKPLPNTKCMSSLHVERSPQSKNKNINICPIKPRQPQKA